MDEGLKFLKELNLCFSCLLSDSSDRWASQGVLLLMLFKLDDTPPPLQKKDMFSKSFFVKGIYYGGYKTKI